MYRALLAVHFSLICSLVAADAPRVVVVAEETIYEYTNADNGSSPLWAFGATSIVRRGDDVYFCATEFLPEATPLSNVRWALMQRHPDGWQVVQRDEVDRTRENSPIGITRDGRIFMSVNPTLTPDERSGPSEPRVLILPPDDPSGAYETFIPRWEGEITFSNHSYRGFAIDAEHGEALILHQDGHYAQHWAFLSRDREWVTGSLVFPDPPEYKREELRYLYPCVALKDRAAYVLARSGATEPVDAWFEHKKQFGGKNVSRRKLGYAWTPDITRQPLCDWIELVNVFETGGEVWSNDLYVAPDGDVHILWFELSVQPELRDKFFPDAPIRRYLKHGIVREGELVTVDTLVEGGEGFDGRPHWGRFHIAEDGRMYLLYNWWVAPSAENAGNHTMLAEILSDGSLSEAAEIPLAMPLGTHFMLASPRGGTQPSEIIDAVDAPWAPRAPVRYVSLALSDTAPQVRIEGDTTLMPGEGRTVNLRAVVDDPQGDVETIVWRLPDGETREGAELVWEAPEDVAWVQATATDAAGNAGVATAVVTVAPGVVADAAAPILLQAEDVVAQEGGRASVVNVIGNDGRSLRNWRSDGHWLQWQFTMPEEGDYAVYARYAAQYPATNDSTLSFDGTETVAENIDWPVTGQAGEYWSDWRWIELAAPVRVSAGEHSLRLSSPGGNPHLDAVAIVPIAQE